MTSRSTSSCTSQVHGPIDGHSPREKTSVPGSAERLKCKSQEEKELRKRGSGSERGTRRKKREEKHLENVAKLKKLRELDFREKNSPAYKKRRKRQVGQLTKLSKSPLLAGCEDIIPHLLKPGANIPMPLSVTGGRNRILALKAKRLEEAQKRAAALALARKEGSKRAVKFGAGVASAFGAAGVERAEKRAIAESNARKSGEEAPAQAGTSGSSARRALRGGRVLRKPRGRAFGKEAEVPHRGAAYECRRGRRGAARGPPPASGPRPTHSEEEVVGDGCAGESATSPTTTRSPAQERLATTARVTEQSQGARGRRSRSSRGGWQAVHRNPLAESPWALGNKRCGPARVAPRGARGGCHPPARITPSESAAALPFVFPLLSFSTLLSKTPASPASPVPAPSTTTKDRCTP